MAKKTPKDTVSIGFEDKIWAAAYQLRGNLNPSDYESVVLGIMEGKKQLKSIGWEI